jgi:hypothetical protein
MILDNTANSLHQDFACGHTDWSSRFMAIPQTDQTKENEQMDEIINLIPTDDPCDESKMTALINNKETTIFLGLDAASGESILLLHILEVLPSSRLQKKPNIRALHRFGDSATTVTLNYTKTMQLASTSGCASLANIRKFTGHEQLVDSIPRTDKSRLKNRALIALPPFISSKLMALVPDLPVDHVLATVLKTIAYYDRRIQQKMTINLTNADDNDKKTDTTEEIELTDKTPAQNPKTGEHIEVKGMKTKQ